MSEVRSRRPGRPASDQIRQRRQEEILDAAVRLFAEHGFAAADTQMLADALGVGKGTIYRYFPSKQELFLAAVDRVMRQLKAAIDRSLEGVEEPLERMARATRAYLTFFAEHPASVELFIQERAHFRDRKKPTYFEHRDANTARWRELFASLIREGRFRAMPVERILDVLGDMVYGTMFTNYFVGRSRSPKDQADDILDIALHGLLSDAGRKRVRVASRKRIGPSSANGGSRPTLRRLRRGS